MRATITITLKLLLSVRQLCVKSPRWSPKPLVLPLVVGFMGKTSVVNAAEIASLPLGIHHLNC